MSRIIGPVCPTRQLSLTCILRVFAKESPFGAPVGGGLHLNFIRHSVILMPLTDPAGRRTGREPSGLWLGSVPLCRSGGRQSLPEDVG